MYVNLIKSGTCTVHVHVCVHLIFWCTCRCAEKFEEVNDKYELHDEQKQLKKSLQSQSIAINQLQSDISVLDKQIEELGKYTIFHSTL